MGSGAGPPAPSSSPSRPPYSLLDEEALLRHHLQRLSARKTLPAALAPGDIWPAGERQAPLLFRPQRFTIDELREAEARTVPSTQYRLQYFFVRSETLVLKRLLEDHGFTAATGPATANLIWCGGHVKPDLLLSLNAHQKVNHYPRTVELTRKDLLVRTLMALRERCGASAYEYLPTTFVLPMEADALAAAMVRDRAATWIVKPTSSSRGRGISLVSQPHQLPPGHEEVVVSKYISRPLLIDGYKFDIRLYVAVTSFEPLRAYIFDEGLARFSTELYQPPDSAFSMANQFIHLTNYSINKKSLSFVQNADASADDHGNKWSLSALKRCLSRNGVDVPLLWRRIDDLVLKALIAVEPSVTAAHRRIVSAGGQRGACFEMLGFDVLIDEALKPWLLEVNLSPSLSADAPLDLKIKSCMLADLFTLVGIRPYDRVAHRTREKHERSARLERLMRGEPTASRSRRSASDALGSLGTSVSQGAVAWTGADAPPAASFGAAAREHAARRAVREMDEEEQRAGGWRRLFPTAAGASYLPLFAHTRQGNVILVRELEARRKKERASRAVAAVAAEVAAAAAARTSGGEADERQEACVNIVPRSDAVLPTAPRYPKRSNVCGDTAASSSIGNEAHASGEVSCFSRADATGGYHISPDGPGKAPGYAGRSAPSVGDISRLERAVRTAVLQDRMLADPIRVMLQQADPEVSMLAGLAHDFALQPSLYSIPPSDAAPYAVTRIGGNVVHLSGSRSVTVQDDDETSGGASLEDCSSEASADSHNGAAIAGTGPVVDGRARGAARRDGELQVKSSCSCCSSHKPGAIIAVATPCENDSPAQTCQRAESSASTQGPTRYEELDGGRLRGASFATLGGAASSSVGAMSARTASRTTTFKSARARSATACRREPPHVDGASAAHLRDRSVYEAASTLSGERNPFHAPSNISNLAGGTNLGSGSRARPRPASAATHRASSGASICSAVRPNSEGGHRPPPDRLAPYAASAYALPLRASSRSSRGGRPTWM